MERLPEGRPFLVWGCAERMTSYAFILTTYKPDPSNCIVLIVRAPADMELVSQFKKPWS